MLRLFLSIAPSHEAALAMLDLLPIESLPSHRAVHADHVHLTVFFLGERNRSELDDVIESCRAACAGIDPFRLQPVRLTTLPARGLKRTVVVECDRPAGLLEIHDRCVLRFARHPTPRSRDRFLPHMTIARFGGAGAECAIDRPIAMPAFDVAHLHLMSSELRPGGARHQPVARYELLRA